MSTGEMTIRLHGQEAPQDEPEPVELPLSTWTPRDFEGFTAAELPRLLRYAVVLTGDEHLAQDVVQDAMVRAHGRWSSIRDMDSPGAYVRRMVTNQYLSWRRAWQVRSIVAVDDAVLHARAPAGGDAAQGVVDRDALWARLGALPRKQRAVLVLRYYEGLSDAEIAETLGSSTSTVRSHASRALATLRVDAHTLREER